MTRGRKQKCKTQDDKSEHAHYLFSKLLMRALGSSIYAKAPLPYAGSKEMAVFVSATSRLSAPLRPKKSNRYDRDNVENPLVEKGASTRLL
jgi:hypothetical protein